MKLDWETRSPLGTHEALTGKRRDWSLRARRIKGVITIRLSGYLDRDAHRLLAARLRNVDSGAKALRLVLDSEGGSLGSLWQATSAIESFGSGLDVVAYVRGRCIGPAYLLACSCVGIIAAPLARVGLGEAGFHEEAVSTLEWAVNQVWNRRPQAICHPGGEHLGEYAEARGMVDKLIRKEVCR